MKVIYFFIASAIAFASCSPVKISIDDPQWEQQEEMDVKGRQGFLIKQKLSFGAYQTTVVKRSWTKGSGWKSSFYTGVDWMEEISLDYIKRRQSIRFQLSNGKGMESEVTAFTKARWRDLQLGRNPNSLINIIGDILNIGDESMHTYAVRIMLSQEGAAWEMLIDNLAAQQKAKTYKGVLAKSRNEYYVIKPIYTLKNKSGKSVPLPFGGSVGYSFVNQDGKTVAAVS
ncbi:MAG TPA: hypothetical protein DCQ34_06180, partial [Chitinophagaceae bacterium]|nr:hypothetical protein [Chitinophagaceae bacterium]